LQSGVKLQDASALEQIFVHSLFAGITVFQTDPIGRETVLMQVNTMKFWSSRIGGALLLAGLVVALSTFAQADELAAKRSVNDAKESHTFVHPLSWTVDYATLRSDYIRSNVRDYTCRLIKRERINGELQAYQFANLKVRNEQRRDGQLEKPMAVFMQFLAPARIKDRRVLYIDGQNNGEVMVHKGGSLLKHLKLSIDPHGRAARRESNYPITDVGLGKLVDRLIQRANDDIERDPKGENTKVLYFRNAKIGDRKCTHIRVVHPEQSNEMEFHIASLYVDDELHVPTRLVVYGWPEREGAEPPLNEEYTYANLRLNVGLSDAEFSESKLDPSRGPREATNATASR
jgi:hypothetical protein